MASHGRYDKRRKAPLLKTAKTLTHNFIDPVDPPAAYGNGNGFPRIQGSKIAGAIDGRGNDTVEIAQAAGGELLPDIGHAWKTIKRSHAVGVECEGINRVAGKGCKTTGK
jgi:hypothetical protein